MRINITVHQTPFTKIKALCCCCVLPRLSAAPVRSLAPWHLSSARHTVPAGIAVPRAFAPALVPLLLMKKTEGPEVSSGPSAVVPSITHSARTARMQRYARMWNTHAGEQLVDLWAVRSCSCRLRRVDGPASGGWTIYACDQSMRCAQCHTACLIDSRP